MNMTSTVDIRPELQAGLARQAAAPGRAVEAYIAILLEEAVSFSCWHGVAAQKVISGETSGTGSLEPGTATYCFCAGIAAGGFLRAAVVFSTNRITLKFSGATWSTMKANGVSSGYMAPILRVLW